MVTNIKKKAGIQLSFFTLVSCGFELFVSDSYYNEGIEISNDETQSLITEYKEKLNSYNNFHYEYSDIEYSYYDKKCSYVGVGFIYDDVSKINYYYSNQNGNYIDDYFVKNVISLTTNEQSIKPGETLNMIVGDSIDFSSNNYSYLPNTTADFGDLIVVLSDSSYADESHHILKEGDFNVSY